MILEERRIPILSRLSPDPMSITWTPENAAKELQRLEGIRDRLAGLIVDLKSMNTPTAETWISIYTQRLHDNVMPAISETRDYLHQNAKMVPGTITQH